MTGDPWTCKVPPKCPECGYNLTGLTSQRCPECGTPVQPKAVKQLAREADSQLIRLKDINDVPKVGLGVGLATVALLVGAVALGSPGVGRVLAFMGGFGSFAMGLSVLRAARAPAEVLERLPGKPNYALGLAVSGLGALLVAASIVLP